MGEKYWYTKIAGKRCKKENIYEFIDALCLVYLRSETKIENTWWYFHIKNILSIPPKIAARLEKGWQYTNLFIACKGQKERKNGHCDKQKQKK